MECLRACAWTLSLLAAAALGAAPGHALALSEEERAAICREAEGRYRDVFGKAPKDEPLTVILMFKDTFCPGNIAVPQGAKVRWINIDKRTSHSIWFKEAGKPESDRVFAEETVEMTIDWPPGEYPYLCGPHWEKEGMIGRLTVTGR